MTIATASSSNNSSTLRLVRGRKEVTMLMDWRSRRCRRRPWWSDTGWPEPAGWRRAGGRVFALGRRADDLMRRRRRLVLDEVNDVADHAGHVVGCSRAHRQLHQTVGRPARRHALLKDLLDGVCGHKP